MYTLLMDTNYNIRLVNKHPSVERRPSPAQTMALRTKGQPMMMTIWTLLHRVRAVFRSRLVPAAATSTVVDSAQSRLRCPRQQNQPRPHHQPARQRPKASVLGARRRRSFQSLQSLKGLQSIRLMNLAKPPYYHIQSLTHSRTHHLKSPRKHLRLVARTNPVKMVIHRSLRSQIRQQLTGLETHIRQHRSPRRHYRRRTHGKRLYL